MAKLTEFENPFSGRKTSIFDFKQIWSMILGVFMMFFVFAMGQRFANMVSSRIPIVDTSIEPIIQQPTKSSTSQKVYV